MCTYICNLSTILTEGTATCTSGGICVSTTVFTECEETTGAEAKRTLAPGPIKARATDVAKPLPPANLVPKTEQTELALVPDLDLKNDNIQLWNTSSLNINDLFPRQSGFGDDGCLYILACADCATAIKVPCLQAGISANTGALSGTSVTATVTEDGIFTCQATLTCSIFDDIFGDEGSCAGIANYTCGGGNSMSWKWNFIEYKSSKYGGAFYPLYLSRTTTDKVVFCLQNTILPAACIEDDFCVQEGPCSS